MDAFLCPACAFVYALSPLGFCLFADKFVFVNINNNINVLIVANSKSGKSSVDGEKRKMKDILRGLQGLLIFY